MRRKGHVSVRELAIFAVMLTVIAAVVVGVSVHRGRGVHARRDGIISLSPALSDLLFEMGLAEQVTGVADYTRLPPGISRPVVGDAMRVNRELVLWLRPRVIVAQQRSEVLDRLRADDKVRVEHFRIETLADLRTALLRLDAIADTRRGEALIRRLDAELEAVRRRVSGRLAPTVLLVVSRDPAMAVGKDTFLDELIEAAGGRNVVEMSGYVTLNDEQLMRLGPQVIVDVAAELNGSGPDVLAARRASWGNLKNVPAVRFDRVCVLTEPTLTIPGASVGRTAEALARRIHPDAFADEPPTTAPSP